jgi:PAS domain S-box-containing protein
MDRSDSASRPGPPSVPGVAYDETRLGALERQNILYTEPEPAFDRITRLATDLLGVPVALVNFVGDDRQWFKSTVGLDETETGLDVSFCVYTIEQEGPMVVENAAEDERFASNPYVREKGLRFYAGVPLEVEDGQRIGTLCVLDTEARSLSEESLRQLTELAEIVEDELQLRRETARRRRAERQKEMQSTFLESMATGAAAEDVLRELCREVERWRPGARVSVLRLEDGRLRHVAAPSLPTEYVEAIDGLEIGPSVATCGTAAHTGEAVIAEDIYDDKRWEGYRDLVSGTRLRSCWSVPVRGRSGEVLGTFAVYATEPTTPSAEERRLIGRMAHVASVALEHERRGKALRESEERFRAVVENARPVVFMTEPDGTLVLAEGEDLEVLGLRPGEAMGESVFEIFDGFPEVTDRIRRALRGEEGEAEVDLDGTILKARVSPFYDEEGTVAGCIGRATDVTERRAQERQLEKTKEQYRTLIEHFPGAVFLYDEDLRCVLTGGRAIDKVGMSREEIEGATPGERYPPEIADPLVDRLRAALDGEQSVLEQRFRGRHFRIEAVPIQEGATCMAVSLDVTERKEAEQARNRLAEAMEVASNGIALLNEEGTYTHMNQAHAEIFGYDAPEAFLGNTWRMCYDEAQVERFEKEIVSTLSEKGTWTGEVPGKRKEGTRFPQQVTLTQLEDGGLICVTRDITERKNAERKLRRSERRFRKVFENAAIGIAIVDDEGRPLRANPALQSMLGYSEGELQGLHFSEITHPDDVEQDLGLFEEVAEDKRDRYQIEKRYVRKDGEVFWARLTASLLDLGDERKHVSLVEDIDQQKRYEEQLRAAKKEAEDAARLKSVMLANMSHEVRTPLTSMIGFASLLADRLGGKTAKLARLIRKSGQRLEETMEAVLQFAQLEAGSYTLDRETLRLDSLLRRIADEFELQAEESDVAIHVETGGDPVEAYVDDTAVRRVLGNLLDNALKFTPEGGEVWVRTYAEGHETVVEIEDTGVGIADEALSDVFEAFKQESEGLTREFEGAGLGLAIVRELVNALGGSIAVDTEKGEGTRMAVRLPRTKGLDPHE